MSILRTARRVTGVRVRLTMNCGLPYDWSVLLTDVRHLFESSHLAEHEIRHDADVGQTEKARWGISVWGQQAMPHEISRYPVGSQQNEHRVNIHIRPHAQKKRGEAHLALADLKPREFERSEKLLKTLRQARSVCHEGVSLSLLAV